jgi:hypothetical protein
MNRGGNYQGREGLKMGILYHRGGTEPLVGTGVPRLKFLGGTEKPFRYSPRLSRMEYPEIIPEHEEEGGGNFRNSQVDLLPQAYGFFEEYKTDKGKTGGKFLKIVPFLGPFYRNNIIETGLFQLLEQGPPGIANPPVEEQGGKARGSRPPGTAYSGIGGHGGIKN